ncbi:MAG: hypothetical protein KDA21_14600 [Phycisphaerales bacterium]|nr:hypothetical protein [Phycisphaerales bacterium]
MCRMLWLSVCAWCLSVSMGEGATVTFRTEVPASTPPGDTIYIAGDFQGWNPGSAAHALTELPDGRWEITLSLPDGVAVQYKFTRGDWGRVEKGPSGEEIPNRVHVPSGIEVVDHVVHNWADIVPSTITGHVEWFEYAPFLGGRRCWVYLPPDYFTSTATYPVLYMHDGQNLFDDATSFLGEWQVDEACEALIGAGEIEPLIVVGIENAGGGRCDEYTPWASGSLPCTGGGGEAYLQAIRDVLIPEVDARYRTRSGPDSTMQSGSSLGGIISVYAAYAHADTWGRVAALSSSYWAQTPIYSFATQTGRPATLSRLYQDMGTLESGTNDGDGNGVNDHVDRLRVMRDIALAQGFVEGKDLLIVEGAGHSHNEYWWSQRFPDVLRFLVNPPPPCADVTGDGMVNFDDLTVVLQAWASDC